MSKTRLLKQILFPILVLALGAFLAKTIIGSGERAERKKPPLVVPLVETSTVKTETRRVSVVVMGQVGPAREVQIRAEVGGIVSRHHPALIEGGRLQEGEELVAIDTRDYQLALAQHRSNVARAKMELQLEQGRRNVAEHEWELLQKEAGPGPKESDLVLRKPQEKSVRAGLQAAQGGLARARLALDKTSVKVPFDALVIAESVEKGQLVGPSMPLATLVGTKRFHVTASVPVDRLRMIQIPGVNARPGEGSLARVTYNAQDGVKLEREARVLRLLGSLEPKGHMARLLLAVDNPLQVDPAKAGHELPLFLGMRVELRIEGVALDKISVLPREALRLGSKVWVVGPEAKLQHVTVDVLWREPAQVWVRGLNAGDSVIVSPLSTPVEGLKVKVKKHKETASS